MFGIGIKRLLALMLLSAGLAGAQVLQPVNGGTGKDSSAWTGCPTVTAGVWTYASCPVSGAGLGANTFTGNQSMTGLTTAILANPGVPSGVATNSGGSIAASTVNHATISAVDSGGNTTAGGTISPAVTTTGGSSVIAWTWAAVPGAVTYYIWAAVGSSTPAYYFTSTTNSYTQTTPASGGTPAASYPAGGAFPFANTTGLINGAIFSFFGTSNANIGGALPSNTTGGNNTASGVGALSRNTTGGSNVASGSNALGNNTTGGSNTAIGTSALLLNTTGSGGTAVGTTALTANTTGGNNTAIGFDALQYIAGSSATDTTAIGYRAGAYYGSGTSQNIAGTYNTFLGENTRAAASGDTNETVIGYNALGNGSNTNTLGNGSVIGTWLNGTIHSVATAPVASVCGSCAVATYSTNAGGAITGLSTDTTVTITFSNSGWTNAAFCVAAPSVSLVSAPYVSAISKTAVTFTFVALTGTLYYHCDGN